MRPSSRVTVAVHVLTLLAHGTGDGTAMTSAYVAGSVGTNPVVVRRLLGLLREARLVRSQGGPGGGWQLVVPAGRITLGDVYRAVEPDALFPLHASDPNPRCPVGRHIQATLGGPYQAARAAVERSLERTSIDDLLREVRARTR